MSIIFPRNKKAFFSPLEVVGVLLLAYCVLPTANSYSQSDIIKYARTVVDTLASPSMHGRGYVNEGESIAAAYIKSEFEKLGVVPFGINYYQSFFLSVNTFPKNPSVKLDGKELVAGRDYLLVNASKHNNGLYKLIWCDTNISVRSIKKHKNPVFVIPSSLKAKNPEAYSCIMQDCNNQSTKALLTREKKLTWGVERDTSLFTKIVIADSLITKDNKTIEIIAEQKFIPNYESQNVIGYIKGTLYPDSFIVFSAHYDHLGRMGKDVYFPGANDNASGCAMLLSLSKYYSQYPPKYSVAFMAFGGEEAGLVGSKNYVEHPLFPLRQIKFLVNMDIMGTGDEGIKVVNATVHKKEFDKLTEINKEKNYLTSVQPRGKAAISDHYFFEEAGVKTFFIYTLGGIKAYHDIFDRTETLPLTKFEEVYKLLVDFQYYLE